MGLSKKHQKTLKRILETPTRSDIRWADIESMLAAMGAELSEGRGSRVRVFLNGIRAVFHRPHPRPDTDRGAVRAVGRLIVEAGFDQEG